MTDQTRPFRFVHCAGLHLDSPFTGLRTVDDQIRPTLREAAFRAFDNVVDLAIREKVDLILIAGGVLDGVDRSLLAQLRFRDTLARAAAVGIPFLLVHGHADPLCEWQVDLRIPPESRRFERDDWDRFTIHREGQPLVDVYGKSCTARGEPLDLAAEFQPDGPSPVTIGLWPGTVDTSDEGGQVAAGSIDDLLTAGMDYWALGQVHQFRILRDNAPTVVCPGHVQGTNIHETGPHGCLLVSVDENGQFHPQFVATDTVRSFERSIDIGRFEHLDGLRAALHDLREQLRSEAEGRAAVVRLHVTGHGPQHALLVHEAIISDLADQIRAGEAARSDFVWVESLLGETLPTADIDALRQADDLVADYLRGTQSLKDSHNPAQAVRQGFLQRPECRAIQTQLNALTDDDLLSILDDAELLGLDLLTISEDR